VSTITLHRVHLLIDRSLYKGLYPLWGRQIPYTMMKFASFENIVAAMYNYLPGTKDDYGKGAQTAVAFTSGYLAGILCAIVSHPADVMVSKLNANRAPGEAFGAAMGRIYKDIGFSGLWNGLPVRIVMIGTLTGLQVGHLDLVSSNNTDMSVVDDLRLVQDLRWSSHDRLWWREERHCQSIDDRIYHDHGCLYVYTENCRLGLEAGCLSSSLIVVRLSNEHYPPSHPTRASAS
jgi:hypothetical protein